jgi:FAD/FMN-containing dehydrogenase
MAAPASRPLPEAPYEPTQAQADAIARIKAVVGERGWTTDAAEMHPHLVEWRGYYEGRAQMVVRPANTAEVAEVVRICHDARLPITPQGGNTSMCGGSVPLEDGEEIVLSLARMNTVRAIDTVNYTMTVEAGCVLQTLQATAAEADRYFPLSLAAEGSCMIGGNLSTNAGGTNVLRYGNAKELVLGLEVVLPDGRVWDGLLGLRKDNTGYDLKQLFLGAEGTLGIITAAVLKLFPKPRAIHAAFCAVRDVPAAMELLGRARSESGDRVETFELISRLVIDLILKHIPGTTDPLAERHQHYVLLELVTTAEDDDALGESFEAILGQAMEDGLVLDAAIAQSEQQRQAFWALRENGSESQKLEGASIKHDISVPVSAIPTFYEDAWKAVQEIEPQARLVAFGHAGDGNLHYNIAEPEGGDRAVFLEKWGAINQAVHDTVHAYHGSISAEHGIGRLKREEMTRYKSEVELDVMKTIKAALDPRGLMNPGKVI